MSEFVGEKDEEGKEKLTHVALKFNDGTEEKVEVGAAFVAIGHDPNTKLFKARPYSTLPDPTRPQQSSTKLVSIYHIFLNNTRSRANHNHDPKPSVLY